MVMNNLILVQYTCTNLFHPLSIQNLILSDKSINIFSQELCNVCNCFFPFLYFFLWILCWNVVDFFIVCPDGFFGDNCSVSCFFPQYGSLCNETCNCSNAFCHHVYGCNTTIVTTTGRSFLILKQNID